MDTALFFRERGAPLAAARAVCARCPVTEECLAAALAVPWAEDFGVWGGQGAVARLAMRRGLRAVDQHPPIEVEELVAFIESNPGLNIPKLLRRWNEEHPERPYRSPAALAYAVRVMKRNDAA